MIASAVPSIGAIASDIKEGGIGDVKTGDVQNVLLAAGLGKQ
jgi:hypothetical protein